MRFLEAVLALMSFFVVVVVFIAGQHKSPLGLTSAAMLLDRDIAMKFGYFPDEKGDWHIAHEEAAVVRLVFAHYVNNHKSMDVVAFNLPTEVSPGALGGKEWLRRHVHTILSDSNYAGVQATPTGFAGAIPFYHFNRTFQCGSTEAFEEDQLES